LYDSTSWRDASSQPPDAQADFFLFLIILTILKSNSAPGSTCIGCPFRIDGFRVYGTGLSMPSAISTNAPKFATRRILPCTMSPMRLLHKERIPNIGLHLLHAERKTALVRFNGQMMALTLSPFFNISDGCFHTGGPAQVADVNQSVDSVSISMKSAKTRSGCVTRPSTVAPTGYLSCSVSQGLEASCRMPSEMRRSGRVHGQHHAVDFIVDVDQL